MRSPSPLLALALAVAPACGSTAEPQPPDASTAVTVAVAPEQITVLGHYDNAVGRSDAASEGVIRAELLKSRPALRPGEVLEFVEEPEASEYRLSRSAREAAGQLAVAPTTAINQQMNC